MPDTIAISLNGTTDLPAGKIAAVVTSLEMLRPPALRPDPPGVEGFSLDSIGREDVARYLAVYRLLGERWMWFSRLVKPIDELQAILSDPRRRVLRGPLRGTGRRPARAGFQGSGRV